MKICRAIGVVLMASVLLSCGTAGTPPPRAPRTVWGAVPEQKAKSPAEVLSPVALDSPKEKQVSLDDPKKDSDAAKKKPVLPRHEGKTTSGLLTPPAGGKGERVPVGEGERQKVVFNFDKADLGEVTSQVFGDYLKLNYVLDPTLQGRISMYLEGEFNRTELLQMIIKAFEANNVSITPQKGLYYIQPLQRSASSSLSLADTITLKPDKDGVRPVIVIYKLRYLDVKQALNTVKSFITPGRPLISDTMSNSLIFVESSDNAHSIVEVLRTMDMNILQEVSMEVVQLQSIAPQDAVQGMDALMGKLGLFKETNLKNNLAFIPLVNFRGVLVLAQTPELLKTARQWINALDTHGGEVGEQIYVYYVQNGLAKDIGDILLQVYGIAAPERRPEKQVVQSTTGRRTFGSGSSFGGGSTSSGFGTSSSGSSFGSSSSSRFRSASSDSSGQYGGTGSAFGQTTGSGASAQRAARSAAGRAGGQSPPTSVSPEVMIIPDEVNNAIVVRANATDYAKIKKTIEALDILPRAVLIEVIIAEVALTKDFEYGLKWYFSHAEVGAGVGQGSLNGLGGVSDIALNLAGISSAGGMALAWVSNAKDMAGVLSWLSSKTKVKILSTPTLLATDNKEAAIQVGGRTPVPSGSYTGGTSTTLDTVFSTIEYEETGTILTVTPHINAGGLVRLEVEQTIRRVGANATVGVNNTAPTFTERNLKTTLLAQDGSTVVIGGIIDEIDRDTTTGAPMLVDVPIIGPLFGQKGKSRERTELLIAITPRVVERRGSDSLREFVGKMRDLRQLIHPNP
ncbi:type II secretion system secretin GspD [Syntrophobacter fumaroxidans]|uniref:General secretion pathway protein D n=1 Tax=Syntrophobacter fumaroxidans (strain DSM 10017 / MPOB) TaxID=335543 RepID=A0LPH6_SYNFM|nr:type II secretion system secretin GspD [Syntrophobacter fumaroxidans]ABK19328.1 general secretion pathway protein D [Syntrophobacter fumaroxidans MPOB]